MVWRLRWPFHQGMVFWRAWGWYFGIEVALGIGRHGSNFGAIAMIQIFRRRIRFCGDFLSFHDSTVSVQPSVILWSSCIFGEPADWEPCETFVAYCGGRDCLTHFAVEA